MRSLISDSDEDEVELGAKMEAADEVLGDWKLPEERLMVTLDAKINEVLVGGGGEAVVVVVVVEDVDDVDKDLDRR